MTSYILLTLTYNITILQQKSAIVHTAIKPANSLTYFFIKIYYMNILLNKT